MSQIKTLEGDKRKEREKKVESNFEQSSDVSFDSQTSTKKNGYTFSVNFLNPIGLKEYHQKFKKEIIEKFKSLNLTFTKDSSTLVFRGSEKSIQDIQKFYSSFSHLFYDLEFMYVPKTFIKGIQKLFMHYDYNLYFEVTDKKIVLFGCLESLNKIRLKIEK